MAEGIKLFKTNTTKRVNRALRTASSFTSGGGEATACGYYMHVTHCWRGEQK